MCSAFSILGRLILSDPSQITFTDTKMHLMLVVNDRHVTSLLDACLHTTSQKRIVYVIPYVFPNLHYELILINNFEQKYYMTYSSYAKLFAYSTFQENIR